MNIRDSAFVALQIRDKALNLVADEFLDFLLLADLIVLE